MPNKCIFCQKEFSEKLTKEHIIHKALGGPWTLPNASCKLCQKICNEEFENDFLKGPNIVAYQRSIWGLKGRNSPPIYGMPNHGGQMLSVVGENFPKVASIQIHGRLDAPPQIIFVNNEGQAIRHRIIKSDFPIPRPISVDSITKILGESPADTVGLALYANGDTIALNIWNELVAAVQSIAKHNHLKFQINSTPVLSSEMTMPINHLGIDRTYAKVTFCYLLKKIDQSLWFEDKFDLIRNFILNGDHRFLKSGNIVNHNSNILDPIHETLGAHPFTYYITLFRLNQSIWASALLPAFGKKYIKLSEKFIPAKFEPAITLFDITPCKAGEQAKVIDISKDRALRFEELVQERVFNQPPKALKAGPLISPIFPVYAEAKEPRYSPIEIYPNITIKQFGVFPFENHLRVICELLDGKTLIVGFDYSRGATLYEYSNDWKVIGKLPSIRSITSMCESKYGKIFYVGQALNGACEIWSSECTTEKWNKAKLPDEINGLAIIENVQDKTLRLFGNIHTEENCYLPIIVESNDLGVHWKIIWQGNEPGIILSRGNGYFGTSGKPAFLYQDRGPSESWTKIYVSPTNEEERIQEIIEVNGIVIAGINRFNKGGYCIYKEKNDFPVWKESNYLPNNEEFVGFLSWKKEFQLICSKNALYLSKDLGITWKDLFRLDQSQEFFKVEKLPSGDVLLLSGITIWRLRFDSYK